MNGHGPRRVPSCAAPNVNKGRDNDEDFYGKTSRY